MPALGVVVLDARDIALLLLDVHAVLGQLHLDGTQPETTAAAGAILHESGSPCTLPGLISALDEVISHLIHAARRAIADITPPSRQDPARPLPRRRGQIRCVLSLISRPCLTESGPLLPRSQLIWPARATQR